MLLNADPKSCAGLLGHHPNRLLTLGDKACAEGGLQATQALDRRIQGGKNAFPDDSDMVLAPLAGSYLTRRWARGPLMVYLDRGTHSYCVKADTRVIIRNYALRD